MSYWDSKAWNIPECFSCLSFLRLLNRSSDPKVLSTLNSRHYSCKGSSLASVIFVHSPRYRETRRCEDNVFFSSPLLSSPSSSHPLLFFPLHSLFFQHTMIPDYNNNNNQNQVLLQCSVLNFLIPSVTLFKNYRCLHTTMGKVSV